VTFLFFITKIKWSFQWNLGGVYGIFQLPKRSNNHVFQSVQRRSNWWDSTCSSIHKDLALMRFFFLLPPLFSLISLKFVLGHPKLELSSHLFFLSIMILLFFIGLYCFGFFYIYNFISFHWFYLIFISNMSLSLFIVDFISFSWLFF
jgi:hypothetical protein